MAKYDLGIFDIEGTISYKKGLPSSVLRMFINLNKKGIKTTVITGTGLIRAKEILGSDFDIVVSSGVPLGVDNGGRVLNKSGEIIRYYPLSNQEIQKVIDFVKRGLVNWVGFFPKEGLKARIWAKEKVDYIESRSKYSRFADVCTGDIDKLNQDLIKSCPALILLRPLDCFTQITKELNAVINKDSIHLNHLDIDKGNAVLDIASYLRIPIDRVFVVGNYLNDVSMFDRSVGLKIFVKSEMSELKDRSDLIYAESIEELPRVLESLI